MKAENSVEATVREKSLPNLKTTIRLKTALLSWLVSITTIAVFAFYMIPQQKQIFLDVLESKAHVLTTSIHDIAASSIVTEDYSEVVDHCMEILQGNESVSYLVLTRNDGFSLIHTRKDWRMDDLKGSWIEGSESRGAGQIQISGLDDSEVYHFDEAFDYSGISWGRVHVGLSLEHYHEGVRSILERTGYIVLFCALLALVASLFYATRLVRPILTLRDAVQRVTKGDLNVRANVTSGDEVESLAFAFNQMTQSVLDREAQVRNQNKQLARLATEKSLHAGDLKKTARRITAVSAETMDVANVGVWLLNKDQSALESLNDFSRATGLHEQGNLLPRKGNEAYFTALENSRVIAIDDVLEDPRTSCLAESYLQPKCVTSMMDSTIRISGIVVGVVCHEHVGEPRSWTAEDENFAGSISDLMALALEARDRRTSQEELLAAKEDAEAASEAKSRFLANMSHEIRTPLNGVVGMLKLLRESPLNTDQKRFVTKGILSSEALLGVINDVLDFSKIEAGKLEIENVRFNLIDITENVVQMFSQQAEDKELELACSIHPQVPEVVIGDPNRISQVLINLVSNAIKFTSSGDVVIRVRQEQERESTVVIRFEIKDSGVGVSMQEKDRIFEPFLQEDSSTTRRFGGTGLGLGICRQLVELMGGEIHVDSVPGQGSSFWFTVHLEKAPLSSMPKPRNGMRGLRALVVDDHEVNREIICEELEAWGCFTASVGQGEEALKRMREQADAGCQYDFAVIDWNMPSMNGEELARRVKVDPDLADIPMILLSSVKDIHPARLEEVGISCWVSKPARQSELHDAIMNAVNNADTPEHIEPVVRSSGIQARGNIRILLAEDNEINQEVAREILRMFGYACDIVNDGQQAVQAVAEGEYDLVFMDCMMPELDGYNATRQIREMEADAKRRVPVIALTANAMKGDREQCLSAGMDDYLSKPLDPDEILGMIEKWYLNADVSDQPALEPECTGEDDEALSFFDREEVLKRCMGNDALVDKLILKFMSQLDDDMCTLEESLSKGDGQSIYTTAHRIKGAAANLSMERLREIAALVEARGRSNDLNEASDGFLHLSVEVGRLREYFRNNQLESL